VKKTFAADRHGHRDQGAPWRPKPQHQDWDATVAPTSKSSSPPRWEFPFGAFCDLRSAAVRGHLAIRASSKHPSLPPGARHQARAAGGSQRDEYSRRRRTVRPPFPPPPPHPPSLPPPFFPPLTFLFSPPLDDAQGITPDGAIPAPTHMAAGWAVAGTPVMWTSRSAPTTAAQRNGVISSWPKA